MKGYFRSEAKFMLICLLGVPFVVIVVGMVATHALRAIYADRPTTAVGL
jgi:hypothetical protein